MLMNWDLATDIILYSAIAIVVVFVFLGLYQWISRKSLKKVDSIILAMPLPLILMAITYFLFNEVWVLATAPDGSGRPSFPSSHVMVVTTIFLMTAIALPHFVKSKPLRIILYLIMFVLFCINAIGRIAAGAHWPADVACGIVFGVIFSSIYYLITREKK